MLFVLLLLLVAGANADSTLWRNSTCIQQGPDHPLHCLPVSGNAFDAWSNLMTAYRAQITMCDIRVMVAEMAQFAAWPVCTCNCIQEHERLQIENRIAATLRLLDRSDRNLRDVQAHCTASDERAKVAADALSEQVKATKKWLEESKTEKDKIDELLQKIKEEEEVEQIGPGPNYLAALVLGALLCVLVGWYCDCHAHWPGPRQP